ncbi:MAG: hypothetical protein IJ588_06320 [Prevotella sp.]|nr:hypothetical protein [Prevotella sp.]
MKKEAKNLKKDGWLPAPGGLPIEQQVEKLYTMQQKTDEFELPVYIMGAGTGVSDSYEAAKMQATISAKQDIAGSIQTDVVAIIENLTTNSQLTAVDAQTLSKTVINAKNQTSQNLGRTIPVMELYRNKSGDGKEVMIRLAYKLDQIMR